MNLCDKPAPATAFNRRHQSSWHLPAAFFLAGFGTFALIYDVQPLLPEFPQDFNVLPSTASLALSLTTITLAAAMLMASRISEIVNRRFLMSGSIVVASTIGIASALSPGGWPMFLLLRALQGLALGGLPAVALAYLSDNVPLEKVTATVGLYVGGTAFGGMSGRLLGGMMVDGLGWRATIGIIAGICFVSGILFFCALPRHDQRHGENSQPQEGMTFSKASIVTLLKRFGEQWRDAQLPRLFIEGGVLLGCLVATYNYLCFRLQEAPFKYSQAKVSLVFLMYFLGVFASPMCGRLAGRFGLVTVLRGSLLVIAIGALISIFDFLPAVLVGAGFITIGFFVGHATASAWVNQRAAAGKALASSQYLTMYYIGASLFGWLGGYAWQFFHWAGVGVMVCLCALAGLWLVPRANRSTSA